MAIGSRIVLPELSGDWAKDGPTMKRALELYINSLQVVSQGVWTPVLTFATAGDLSVTYATQSGAYYKFGSIVVAIATVITSAFTHTTASGILEITGLPFTADNPASLSLGGFAGWSGITKAGYTELSPLVAGATDYVQFTMSGSGSAAASVTAADLPTGGYVAFNLTVVYAA